MQAPPGAGKTTLVPTALERSRWLGDQTIVMLEPRRLAARAAAYRIADLRSEAVGETIGYRMRGDTRVGPRTRIEVVTEGVLTRRLQRDPTLDGVGLVIFDEFHERSLDADLGLALTLRTRSLVRSDLRVLVMSATLDGQAVAALLGGAPILSSEGRSFPVETRYRPPRGDTRIEGAVVATILAALRDDTGDVLVFLPGAGEIRRVEASLGERDIGSALVLPLYGALTHDAQDRAIRPDPHGRRKVVLSTSIAETSLTIDGVHVVIDAGVSRIPRFSPSTGMTRLETVRVSRASADQRRGRAGRLGPGVCYRLWAEHEDSHLLANTPPEIVSADLTPLALDLAAAGVSDPSELKWLDAPPSAAYAQARELLRELSALDDRGITAHGREMAMLPVHPRLAHMLIRSRSSGDETVACDIAALLSERDVFRSTSGPIDADLSLRIACVRGDRDAAPAGADVDRDALRRVRAESERLTRQIRARPRVMTSTDAIGRVLALAYPDRVGQRRTGSRARFVLRNGRGAELAGAQSLFESAYIVAAALDDQRPESRVFLAASVDEQEIREVFDDQIVAEDVVEFDDTTSSVAARRRERLGAIVLKDVALGQPDPDRIHEALLAAVCRRGISSLPWSESALRFRSRLAFLHATFPEWPDVSDAGLAERIGEWLAPALGRARSWADLERVDFAAALLDLLDWTHRRALDDLAPTHVGVPSGSRIPIDYTDPFAPVLAVRLQEVFGLTESPRIANGRVAVTMHLLSPAGRPVQVTRDLGGFWRTSYFDVRKDMRGRYPRHEWPEDPLTAPPTARAKRRPPR